MSSDRNDEPNDEPNAQDKKICRVNEIRELIISEGRRSPSKRWCILSSKSWKGKRKICQVRSERRKDHGTTSAKQALPASWEKRKKTLS